MKINQNKEIEFVLVKEDQEEEDDDDYDDEENYASKKRKLRKFKDLSLFRIVVKSKPKKTKKMKQIEEDDDEDEENEEEDDDDDKMFTYYYQTNRDEEVEKVELNGKATVKTLKEYIAKEKGVSSTSNVKIIFAGKVLLSNIVLKSLEIGDMILFAYLRTEKEVFLMTAKALQYVDESSSNEEENEYESESD